MGPARTTPMGMNPISPVRARALASPSLRLVRLVRLVRPLLLAVVALSFTTGCSKATRHDAAVTAAVSPSPGGGMPETRMRAITVDTTVTVTNVDTTTRNLRDAAEHAGGYVADASLSGAADERAAQLDLRVPASSLRVFLATLAGAGETQAYAERAEDVTEQRADLKARLTNARTQEKRVLELMAGKAATLAETLEAEKELSRIRENIERLDAQDHAMETRIQLVTVRVALRMHTTDAWRTPGKSIASAAGAGLRGAAAVFVFLAMTVVTVAPTMLPLALFILALVTLAKMRAKKKLAALREGAVER